MSDLIINIRFLFWHLKVTQGTWKTRVTFNPWHWKYKGQVFKRPFEVYEWRLSGK